jgi:hypothetical protein
MKSEELRCSLDSGDSNYIPLITYLGKCHMEDQEEDETILK